MTTEERVVKVAEKFIKLEETGKSYVEGVMQGILLEKNKSAKPEKSA